MQPGTLPGTTVRGVFRALDIVFELEASGAKAPEVIRMLEGLRTSDQPPSTRFSVAFDSSDRGSLVQDGTAIASGSVRALVQALVSAVARPLTEPGAPPAIHATTVSADGAGVALVGRSRQGKSTMAAALLQHGFGLVAEDVTAFEPGSLAAREYHRPLGLARRALELLGITDVDRFDDCGCGGKLLIEARELGFELHAAAPVHVFALCDRRSATLRRLTPGHAMVRVLQDGIAPIPEPVAHLEVLANVLARAHCLELGTHELEVAVDWIQQLVERETPATPTWVDDRATHVDVFFEREAVVLMKAEHEVHHLNDAALAVWLALDAGDTVEAAATSIGLREATVRDVAADLAARGLLEIEAAPSTD